MGELLRNLGVTHIFLGAGNRNEPLLGGLHCFELIFDLDERALAFQALGFAKITQRPAVVCTTSGTAVAECLPAVIEAYYSDIPLIIVSADRPKSLHGTRAPQSIDQKNIFGKYARTHHSGKLEDLSLSDVKYPLHINLEVHVEDFVQTRLDGSPKVGIGIFTEGSKQYEYEFKLLKERGFVLYNEVHSGLNQKGTIKYEKDLIQLVRESSSGLMIKFGKTPVTKLWRLINEQFPNFEIYSYKNKNIGAARGEILDSLDELPRFKKMDLPDSNLFSSINKYPQSEISVVKNIVENIEQDDLIFVGNSMPIRYLDFFKGEGLNVFASRGANGIDGQLSTAIGIAQGTSQQVHALLGDLTFIYDSNRIYSDWPSNFKVHILNNHGGRIFERVKADRRMILETQNFLEFGKKKDQIFEYQIDNAQTNQFWKEWLGE